MRKVLTGVFVLTLVLLVAACGSSPSEGDGEGDASKESTDIKIGYAINTLNNPFFVSVKEGAEKEASDLGIELFVSNANDDLATQLSGIEDLIQKQVDVLIIDPVDSQGALPAIQSAVNAGVKVVTTGRRVEGAEVVTHLGYDEIMHGMTSGEFLAEQLNGKGNVVELQGVLGTDVAKDRSEGFNQAMEEYSDINIIATQSANFDRTEALKVMENILQANEQIDGLYAANDEMALGALQAIKAANREGIVIVSNDGTADAFEVIKTGEIAGTMAIYPNQYGQKAVEIAVEVANGKSQSDFVELPSIFVSKENVEEAIEESQQ